MVAVGPQIELGLGFFWVEAMVRSSDSMCATVQVQLVQCESENGLFSMSRVSVFFWWHGKLYRTDSSEAWQMQNCLSPNIVHGALLDMVIWKAIHMYC
jgi:hypothetical protein